MEDKPCAFSIFSSCINVGNMKGEYGLSLEAIINAMLMAHMKSKSPAHEQPEGTCWDV